ncbi:MAG TPA: trypsin-like serine protease [Nitrospinaceae bacterium]|nr:trypsin-like serine protease [Micavibrio sp.]HIL27508.1 trypsin-like serine protease [Nitrospinaceae bacterium]
MIDFSDTILPSQEAIAKKFGYTYDQLSSLIYPKVNKSYHSFTISKKNGELREINAPKILLLKVQQTLAEELSSCYTPKNATHGFIKERSIVTNAKKHIGKRNVFNIDLKDFYGSIHFGRVRNLLMSKPFMYSQSEATILAQICCYNGALPQGAPTSPIISNLICWKMDALLQNLASENRCTYTRYADDITFSFNVKKSKLPSSIVRFDLKKDRAIVGYELSKIIEESGFVINEEKVRLAGKNQRQEVTGITVNKKPNVSRKFIRQTASMLYAWKKFGAEQAEHDYLDKYRVKKLTNWQSEKFKGAKGEFFIKVVKGRVNYIQMVRGRDDKIYRKLAFKLTDALGKPNIHFTKSREELATYVIEWMEAQGTGFLLDGVGIVTNEHVISGITSDNYAMCNVYRCYEEDKKQKCPLIFADKAIDLAVLDPTSYLSDVKPYKIGEDKYLEIGDTVKVIGFPKFGPGSTPNISEGIITSKKKIHGIDAFIVNTPITDGASGGPVLDNNNEVIGVAFWGPEHNDGSNPINGFIPISTLKNALEQHSLTNSFGAKKPVKQQKEK